METAESKKDSNDKKEDLAYENESFVADLLGDATKGNNLAPGGIISAKLAGTKWNHLVKRRRSSRQPFTASTDGIPGFFNLGLDDDLEQAERKATHNMKQAALNKALISHFIHLAKTNTSEDEVDLDFIEQLLREGADINCCDKHGQGMLHEAARAWHTDIVLFLLEHGANINLADNYHRTALHIAAAVDYPEMVECLVDKGANIEAITKEENQTPLHFAARNDAVESLKMLLKLGAEIEVKDYKERTPMFVAAELDRSETAKQLLEENADVSVVDKSGLICMTHMIRKMGPVAKSALDQFHRKDRANRRQYFYLNLLEVPRAEKGDKLSLAKTPLQVIVNFGQLDLIMHPVIMRLIDIKWKQFGRRIALRTLLINLIYVLIWTVLGVGYPWQLRYLYTFPQDWWRVFLLVLGCLMTVYYIYAEITEVLQSRRRFDKWKSWREVEIKKDMNFCHPKWPEERKYLEREIQTLDDMLPSYFRDFWNYFDWTVYFLLLLVFVLHMIEISLNNSVPACCSSDGLCNDPSYLVCQDGFVNNASLSVWINRIFALTILFLWLRLMKFTRAFRFLGPFIVMLGKLTYDILRFFYLYAEFFIPYACAFWMIFGNVSTISSMSTVDQLLFSLFRITLVDEYQFQEMHAYDVVMAYILIGTFLGISAILCLNLFIALLSDTFQRVYDNANANAVMQQAALLLNFEEGLSVRSKKHFRKFIQKKCSPESLYYDDDLTVAQDSDLKKVTIQIKEQMDELMEHVRKAEIERADDDNDFSSSRRFKPKGSTRGKNIFGVPTPSAGLPAHADVRGSNETMQRVSTKMTEFTSRLQKLQVSQAGQEDSYKRIRDEVKEIRNMLSVLMPPGYQPNGGGRGENLGGRLFTPSASLSTVVEQAAAASQRPESSKKGGLFKRILGSSKATPVTISPRNETGLPPGFVPSTSPPVNRNLELVSLPGSTNGNMREEAADHGGNAPQTVGGLVTADITIRSPSGGDSPADSNV